MLTLTSISDQDLEISRRIALLEEEQKAFRDLHVGELRTICIDSISDDLVVVYGGCRSGGKAFRVQDMTQLVMTLVPNIEQDEGVKKLTAEWNRAKVQKNKNLMRDIEKRIKCIQES